ncbi:putative ribosome biogenesis GTPase RsgA [Chitiniphilus shinanonensis]|uniref:Small ribosomal subunit biogenesis GTPase RsgA n=1 Tax=Chitiniphilus shinanonensis TaxID=553088 RepID=A0ABQ6BSW2_9NEIS|nr:ribosome small subunit-dependent GTPase A [Chitiniphilus shinanonensis]GLS04881.1 putative ribosome biogenesis GTPase RsgA [Chitiniphilus shinanonensis]
MNANTATTATIVASHGRAYIVEQADGTRLSASARGKKTDYACGDRVRIKVLNAEQAVIEGVEPRSTLLYRSDQWREKLIAANVTQLVIVAAPVPSFSEELIGRCLIAAEAEDIAPLIVLNKCDLPEADAARQKMAFWRALGYRVLELSAQQQIAPLLPYLQGQTSVLVGQSGMGKSTITNALLPDARARVNEISVALDSGKHTTTHATLYHLDAASHLIDSPGLQSFGLAHVTAEALPGLMPDLREHLGGCRFHNCRHRAEPGCALRAATDQGTIRPDRLALLHRLQDELAAAAAY